MPSLPSPRHAHTGIPIAAPVPATFAAMLAPSQAEGKGGIGLQKELTMVDSHPVRLGKVTGLTSLNIELSWRFVLCVDLFSHLHANGDVQTVI